MKEIIAQVLCKRWNYVSSNGNNMSRAFVFPHLKSIARAMIPTQKPQHDWWQVTGVDVPVETCGRFRWDLSRSIEGECPHPLGVTIFWREKYLYDNTTIKMITLKSRGGLLSGNSFRKYNLLASIFWETYNYPPTPMWWYHLLHQYTHLSTHSTHDQNLTIPIYPLWPHISTPINRQ